MIRTNERPPFDERQIARLEQNGWGFARDADGNAISVTQIVVPPPLEMSDAEYLELLFGVIGIMQDVREEA